MRLLRVWSIVPVVFVACVIACGSSGDGGTSSAPKPDDPVDDHTLQSFAGDPTFDPDYNRLTAQPWVLPATAQETADVEVGPDYLKFPLAGHADVLAWEAGRIVASAPDKTKGTKNPFGFARRVLSVDNNDPTIIVHTESVGLEEMFQGDFQLVIDPDKTTPVDLTNVDLDWAATNLYQDLDIFDMPGDTLDDDVQSPDDLAFDIVPQGASLGPIAPQSWGSFWKSVKKGANEIGKKIGGAAKAVANAAKDVWLAVTPATVSGSVSLSKEMAVDYTSKLFELSFTKDFRTKKQTAFQLFVEGSGDVTASLKFNPGFQVGAKIPVPGHKAHTDLWMNIDSHLATSLKMNFSVAAGLRSVEGEPANETEEQYRALGEKGNEVLSAMREKLLGDKDMKPVGGWKRTLFISRPAYTSFFAGPIPVVITSTLQLDLECGFEVKAHLDATLSLAQDARFKYSVRYDGATNTTSSTTPTFLNDKKANVEVTGGGSVAVSCGLIPRLNVFAYDTLGIFAGVRGSLVAKASLEEECSSKDPNSSRPNATVTAGLYANVGVQVGARVQAPGSSFLGKGGQKLGTDIGPFEPWNKEFALVSKSWQFPGFGYCLPQCRDLSLDGSETDVDCGGSCSTRCAAGRHCRKSSECSTGYCSGGRCGSDTCGTQVQDGKETDVDCGGPACAACAIGKDCLVGADCQSGFCAASAPGNGARIGTCAADQCADGVRDADECGVDCGGAKCGKCKTGAVCADDVWCASGVSDGRHCVADHCHDGVQDADEGGVDCGGAKCRKCIGGMTCTKDGDCSPGASLCDATKHVCVVAPVTCAAIHTANASAPDGVYEVDPDGAGPNAPFPVFCNMTYAGGGWTRVGYENGGEGAMQFLGHETGTPAGIAAGTSNGLIGPRFGGKYTEVDIDYFVDGVRNHVRFTPASDIFVNALANTGTTTIAMTLTAADDAALTGAITQGGGARFCRASHFNDVRPGRTSWGIKPLNDLFFDCGCSGPNDEGSGVFYGGAALGTQTSCDGRGGSFQGFSPSGGQKGGVTFNETKLSVK